MAGRTPLFDRLIAPRAAHRALGPRRARPARGRPRRDRARPAMVEAVARTCADTRSVESRLRYHRALLHLVGRGRARRARRRPLPPARSLARPRQARDQLHGLPTLLRAIPAPRAATHLRAFRQPRCGAELRAEG
jgi:hypothetical protein